MISIKDEYRQYESSIMYLEKRKNIIRDVYGNRFIAIHSGGRIVDSDTNEMELVERMAKVYGVKNDCVLIGTLDDLLKNTRIIEK